MDDWFDRLSTTNDWILKIRNSQREAKNIFRSYVFTNLKGSTIQGRNLILQIWYFNLNAQAIIHIEKDSFKQAKKNLYFPQK